MEAINRILLPVDFTRIAARALCHAAALAHQLGATLHLLHVGRHDPAGGETPDRVEARLAAFVARVDEEADGRFRSRPGAPEGAGPVFQLAVRHDADVARAVCAYAQEEGIDLILMGTRGYRDGGSFFEERTAGRVALQAPCPVITIGLRGLYRPWGLRRILVPVAFTSASAVALRQARALSAGTGAHLLVLHVVDTPPWHEDPGEEATRRAWHMMERAYDDLDAFYRDAGGPEGPRLSIVRRGHPARHVMALAYRWDADLIVLPAREEGDVGAALVRRAPCPVLLARSDPEPSAVTGEAWPRRADRAPALAAAVHA